MHIGVNLSQLSGADLNLATWRRNILHGMSFREREVYQAAVNVASMKKSHVEGHVQVQVKVHVHVCDRMRA